MSHVRVKICGITSPQDAEVAANAGADAIGLVFYPPSSRHIDDMGLAKEIAQAVGPFVSVVALSVNQEPSFIEHLLNRVPINVLQFHGDEAEAACTPYSVPYIKAIRMKDGIDVRVLIAQYPSAQGILLDTYSKGVPGGTGEKFNWDRVPNNPAKPIVLAGGLNPGNVGEAILSALPNAVDVSGGVEARPGVKDPQKVKDFIANAKNAER